MKDEILNIINIEEITKVRNSINADLNLPPKNSFVSLIPIEFLEKGAKVLIDGKLFIAFIDEKIPLKEEIIALVSSTQPFTLSLNLSSFLIKNKSFVLEQVVRKLSMKNNEKQKNIIASVIQEEKPLIKSNLLLMSNLTNKLNTTGLELSLLINLVWDYSNDNMLSISNLFEDLFDDPFEKVCEKLFSITKELLFTNISPFILHQLNTDIIYDDEDNNIQAITNKSKSILAIIKSINETYQTSKSNALNEFVKLGSTYILQKSVFKDYDYHPDFVIVRHETELTLVKYNIKKTFSNNDVPIYKLSFKHDDLPFELTGIIRNGFLLGNIDVDQDKVDQYLNEIDSFNELLQQKVNLASNVKINSESEDKVDLVTYKTGLNKLIS